MKISAIIFAVMLPIAALAYMSPGVPQGFVSDFAGLLTPEQKQDLEMKAQALFSSSTNEIAVVTVPSLGGDTAENFSTKLFEDWKIGKRGKDNGVLILIAPAERAMRIEVGYGLEGLLTDAQSSVIMSKIMTPRFQQGDFYGGISGALDAVATALGGAKVVVPEQQSSSFSVDFFWLFLFIPIWLASILGRSKSWWLGGVLGGISGVVIGFIYGFVYMGAVAIPSLVVLGLLFDFVVSRSYARARLTGNYPWWIGGHRHLGGGGGFGGFGGGRSGGGGASGRWEK